ncbi:MAG: L,D-transpeptidase family protein [Pseudomonadota bacterium]
MRKLICLLLFVQPALADTYVLPPDGIDVVGSLSTVIATQDDTLVDLAREHGLGYYDIVRANPDVNPWVPGEGTEIVLPRRFILPSAPREGVVLNLAEYRMYYYPAPTAGEEPVVMTFPISIGRMDWETPLGITQVIQKAERPAWYPPKSIREEHAAEGRPLPAVVPPGPDNPLGDFAMRLGLPGYLIHGTNRPAGVGMRVTHGCIRMFPEDIEFVFPKISLKTKVRIVNEPIKIGWDGDALVMEAHPVLESTPDPEAEEPVEEIIPKDPLTYVTEQFIVATEERAGRLDWDEVELQLASLHGIPVNVGEMLEVPVEESPAAEGLAEEEIVSAPVAAN